MSKAWVKCTKAKCVNATFLFAIESLTFVWESRDANNCGDWFSITFLKELSRSTKMFMFVALRSDVIQRAINMPRFLFFGSLIFEALLIDGCQHLDSIVIRSNRSQSGFVPPQDKNGSAKSKI